MSEQRNDTLVNLFIAFAVAMAVLFIAPRMFPTVPPPPPAGVDGGLSNGTTPVVPSLTDSSPEQRPAATTSASGPGVFTALEITSDMTRTLGAAIQPDEPVNRKEKRSFRTHVVVHNMGASVERALSTEHWQDSDTKIPYPLLAPIERVDLPTLYSLAVEKINIDGQHDVILYDKRWNVGEVETYQEGEQTGQQVTAWIDIAREGTPLLRVSRRFRLPVTDKPPHTYDLFADISVENLDPAQEHKVILTYRGGLGMEATDSRMDDHVLDIALTQDGSYKGSRKTVSSIAKGGASTQPIYNWKSQEKNHRFSWGATGNHYFTCTVAPLNRDGSDNANYLQAVTAVDFDASTATTEDVTLRFVTFQETLAAGATLVYPVEVFIGPKSATSFKKVKRYAERNYYHQISRNFGWCTFSFLVELMLWLLNSLHLVVRNYGVAIIMLVFIVRVVRHPIAVKQGINMARMQARAAELAPKMEEIRRKYADDKTRMNQELLKLQNPIEPLLGCLPMLLQLPIMAALFISLSNNIEMRQQPFILWMVDLTKPDALLKFGSFHIPLLSGMMGPIRSLNILPFVLAISLYVQQKTMPKPKPSPSMTPEQRQQQEMMQNMAPIMTVMMLIFFYNAPSGLTLYFLVSNLFGIVEQRWIKAKIREQEEAGTLLKKPQPRVVPAGTVKKMPGFLSRLQSMAQDAQDNARKQQSKRRQ